MTMNVPHNKKLNNRRYNIALALPFQILGESAEAAAPAQCPESVAVFVPILFTDIYLVNSPVIANF